MFYVIIGVAVSFFIAGFCEDENKPRLIVFRTAFIFEFFFVFIGECFLLQNKLGFFSDKELTVETFSIVVAVSLIASILIGLKAAYPHLN